MRLLVFTILCALFALSSFSQQVDGVDTVYTPDGKIDGYGPVKDGKRVDTWRFNIYGEKSYMTVTYLVDGKGIVKYFDDKDTYEQIYLNCRATTYKVIKNNIFYLENYTEAIIRQDYTLIADGEHIGYYPNGVPYDKGNYKNGYREGEWLIWYSSGKLGNRLNFKHNKLDSLFTTYYENGQIMFTGNYKEDARTGEWKEYYENGKLKSEGSYCIDIAPVIVTYDNVDSLKKEYPNLIDDTIFVNYALDFKSGTWKYYNGEGKLIREEFYEKGKLIKTQDY